MRKYLFTLTTSDDDSPGLVSVSWMVPEMEAMMVRTDMERRYGPGVQALMSEDTRESLDGPAGEKIIIGDVPPGPGRA